MEPSGRVWGGGGGGGGGGGATERTGSRVLSNDTRSGGRSKKGEGDVQEVEY